MNTFRRTAFSAGTGSMARSVEAYYPFYPPPVVDPAATRNERNGYQGFAQVPLASNTTGGPDDGIVNRVNMRQGERSFFRHGGVMMTPFHMRATGQVESSMAQRVQSMSAGWSVNQWLYRALKGYPMNLGLSVKVPTLPKAALGVTPAQMTPAPRFSRNVFVNRRFNGIQSVPAKPQNR